MAIEFANEEGMGAVDPIQALYEEKGLSPDMPVSAMSVGAASSLPHGEAPGEVSMPVPGEQPSAPESDVNGRVYDFPLHRLGETGLTGLGLIQELERRGDLEGLKKLADPEIDHAAEYRAMDENADRFSKSYEPGGANYSPYAQPFQGVPNRADGTKIPPIVNGRRMSGEEWEIRGDS